MNRHHIQSVVSFLVFVLSSAVGAVEFAGGTGEPNDPYQIATAGQLISIGSDPNLEDKHFILIADIDMDPNLTGGWSTGVVLSTGSLDGDGHGVFNFQAKYQPRYDHSPYALFGSIGSGAVVRNLSLKGIPADTSSLSARGAVLASTNEGFIFNCRVETWLSAYTGGGLAGANLGTIANCSVGGSITGNLAGGLVGINSGSIANCWSTADVTRGSGLVGENSGTIVACYATGEVTNGAGGLVGENSGTIRYCYATGDTYTSGDLVGGLVGTNSGEISYCYATGSGGMALLAENEDGTIRSCYALAESDGGGIDDGFAIVLTEAQMRRQECFVGWDFAGTQTDGSLDYWTMPEGGGYPLLVGGEAFELAGAGTVEDPYLVETHHQLMAIRYEPQAWYRLVADIDLQGESFSEPVIPIFSGHLDGAGHNVFNFTLTGQYDLGLLGVIGSEATVSDLRLCDVHTEITTTEGQQVGALAACNRGRVMNCSAAMEMTAVGDRWTHDAGGLIGVNEGGQVYRCSSRVALMYDNVASRGSALYCAGLVGYNTGAVGQCHASAYTNSEAAGFGGLVGLNEGSITDCYADGHLSGYGAAGLVYSNSGSITNCYAAAIIPAAAPAAGLVVENSNANISNAYFLAEADGGGPDNGYGTALSIGEMQQQASFVGWDFETVWTINEGQEYPRLQWEETVSAQ